MTDRNQALFDRAAQVIPGGVNSPVRAFRAVGGTPYQATYTNLFFGTAPVAVNGTTLPGLGLTKEEIPGNVQSLTAEDDKRKRLLGFTAEGARLELALRREQARLLQRVFAEVGEEAVQGWLKVNQALTVRR